MIRSFGRRPLARAAASWPAAVLLLALSTVFLFDADRDVFYLSLAHDWNSAKWLAAAENLSPARPFLFDQMTWRSNGTIKYDVYSRYPIGGYLLIKLAIWPFEGDFAAQTTAARVAMLALFSLAAALTYHALARLTGRRAVALAATLLTFSSYYMLHHSDQISSEASMGLFAVMLAFHGMVRFELDDPPSRLPQLLLKVCAALLLAWQVVGLLLAFCGFGMARAVVRGRRRGRGAAAEAADALRTPYFRLAALALLVGVASLGHNLAGEHLALGGKRALAELPTVRSMGRTLSVGADESPWSLQSWGAYPKVQLHRVGGMVLPHALYPGNRERRSPDVPGWPFAVVGMLTLAACAIGCFSARSPLDHASRRLLGILVASGLCWTALMREHTAGLAHDFESIFFIGAPLTTFALLALGAAKVGARLNAERVAAACLAGGAAAVFAASAARVAHAGQQPDSAAETERAIQAEFEAIRGVTRGKRVLVAVGESAVHRAVEPGGHVQSHAGQTRVEDESGRMIFYYYMAGRALRYAHDLGEAERLESSGAADFVLAFERVETPGLRTPAHRFVFLYAPGGAIRAIAQAQARRFRRIAAGEPAARGPFNIHRLAAADGRSAELAYLRAPCRPAETDGHFFLSMHAVRPETLPPWRREHGFEAAEFRFDRYGVIFGDMCMMRIPLPRHRVANVTTGQRRRDETKWRRTFFASLDVLRAAYAAARASAPAGRGAFDVHVAPQALTYVREPCVADDIRARFFLHVFRSPAAPAGAFDNLDFDFREHGALFEGKCVAAVRLPAGRIATVTTGQFRAGPGSAPTTTWQTTIEITR